MHRSKNFEERLIFDTKTSLYAHNDNETKNLIKLLDLNNIDLVKDRHNKITLLKDLFGEGNTNSFSEWLKNPKSKQDLIEFRRAIETVFDVKL